MDATSTQSREDREFYLAADTLVVLAKALHHVGFASHVIEEKIGRAAGVLGQRLEMLCLPTGMMLTMFRDFSETVSEKGTVRFSSPGIGKSGQSPTVLLSGLADILWALRGARLRGVTCRPIAGRLDVRHRGWARRLGDSADYGEWNPVRLDAEAQSGRALCR